MYVGQQGLIGMIVDRKVVLGSIVEAVYVPRTCLEPLPHHSLFLVYSLAGYQ